MKTFKELKEFFNKKIQANKIFETKVITINKNVNEKTLIEVDETYKDKKALVVLSGGLDSTVLLTWAQKVFKEVEAISFDFKQQYIANSVASNIMFQNNIVELECAKALTQKLNIKHTIVDVSYMNEILKEMQIRKQEFNNTMLSETNQPKTNMPFRNLMLLSNSLAVAELSKCDYVLNGFQEQDEHGYWDTSKTFVAKINAIANLNPKCKIEIISPFIKLNKSDEIILGNELGVDFSKTWSCYNPLVNVNENSAQKYLCCGYCPACKDRQLNFFKLNLKDPLEYYEKIESEN